MKFSCHLSDNICFAFPFLPGICATMRKTLALLLSFAKSTISTNSVSVNKTSWKSLEKYINNEM